MNSPDPIPFPNSQLLKPLFVLCLLLLGSLALSACGKTTKAEPDPRTTKLIEAKKAPPTAVPMWLGNPARTFYGTGPWSDKPLEVVWDFKTSWTRGRLHKDPWGGSGWPGQPAIVEDRVYFGSAGGYVYCLNRKDGSLIWSYQTIDGAKSSRCPKGLPQPRTLLLCFFFHLLKDGQAEIG